MLTMANYRIIAKIIQEKIFWGGGGQEDKYSF